MKTKLTKCFLVFAMFAILTVFSSINHAEVKSAEVFVSPSNIEAGKSQVIVYLLGLNSQLFSHSSSKEPTVEADTGVVIKDFRVLSPKRAQLTIDTERETLGAIQHNLKFYDTTGVNVVKTCVFYINVLGPKTVSDIKVTMYSIPEIYLGETNIQETGSFELEGVLTGKITITPPTNIKFKTDLPPRITSLSVNATVDRIKVDETGDDIEFFVENPLNEVIRLFFTGVFIDTSNASDSNIKGNITLQVHSDTFVDTVSVHVGHTPGYTVSEDENINSNDERESSNTNTGSTSGGGWTYDSNNSSRSNDEDDNNSADNKDATRSPRGYSSGVTYYGGRYRGNNRGYNNSSPRNIRSGYNSSQGVRGNYRSRPRNSNSNKNAGKPAENKIDTSKMVNNFKKKIEVAPSKDEKFKILQVAFCNKSFDKKAAIPLKATNKGFEASMNLEIIIEMMNDIPDSIEVNISVGSKFRKSVRLIHLKHGIFRSTEVQNFSISYAEISRN